MMNHFLGHIFSSWLHNPTHGNHRRFHLIFDSGLLVHRMHVHDTLRVYHNRLGLKEEWRFERR